MKTKTIIALIIVLVIIAGIAFYIFENMKGADIGTGTIPIAEVEEYTNLQTSDDSFGAIDKSVELLE